MDDVDEKDLTWEYDHRAEALRAIVTALAEARQFSEAEAMASRIKDEWYCRSCRSMRTLALNDLAVALLAHDRVTHARRVFDKVGAEVAERGVRRLDEQVRRELILTRSHALALAGQVKALKVTARGVAEDHLRARVLADLGAALDARGRSGEAASAFAEAATIVERWTTTTSEPPAGEGSAPPWLEPDAAKRLGAARMASTTSTTEHWH